VSAAEQAGEICRKVIEASWKVCHFQALPHWLQDNDYLIWGHRYIDLIYFYRRKFRNCTNLINFVFPVLICRPPLPSFSACFQSIFRIHTETGNIWTHLIGTVLFVTLAVSYLLHNQMSFHVGHNAG